MKQVCKLCGNIIIEKKLQFGAYQEAVPYCEHCRQIESGTTEQIFNSAEKYVLKSKFQYFLNAEDDERCEQRNISKICEILNVFYINLNIFPADLDSIK